jgi:hypothetical protein
VAGSWRHMTAENGKLLNSENFAGMVENLGDAYEAAEECYGMIWWLARALAERWPEESENPPRDKVLDVIRQAAANYKDGVRAGGVQRSR